MDRKQPIFLQPEFKALEHSNCEDEILEGMEIAIWKDRLDHVECLTQAKRMYIDKVPVAIINKRGINSNFFKAICKKYGDIQCSISFGYDLLARSWVVTFYDGMDKNGKPRDYDALSLMIKICNQADPKTLINYGGHKGACGMNTYDIENDLLKFINKAPH